MSTMLDKAVLISAWVLIGAMIMKIPKARRREAQAIILFHQFLTWLFGLLVVEYGLLEYPVREFQVATRTSFTFEYIGFPVIAVYYNLYHPFARGFWRPFLYVAAFASAVTIPEVLIERYTNLLDYYAWTWYYSWISMLLTLYASRLFYYAFFLPPNKSGIPAILQKNIDGIMAKRYDQKR